IAVKTARSTAALRMAEFSKALMVLKKCSGVTGRRGAVDMQVPPLREGSMIGTGGIGWQLKRENQWRILPWLARQSEEKFFGLGNSLRARTIGTRRQFRGGFLASRQLKNAQCYFLCSPKNKRYCEEMRTFEWYMSLSTSRVSTPQTGQGC